MCCSLRLAHNFLTNLEPDYPDQGLVTFAQKNLIVAVNVNAWKQLQLEFSTPTPGADLAATPRPGGRN